MSNVAFNPQTGEVLVIDPQGQWQPAQRARNPQTGAEIFYDGQSWQPVPRAPAPQPPASTPQRGLGLGIRDVAQGVMAIPGMAYDAAGGLINTATGALQAIGGPNLPRVRTASQNIDALATAVGLPEPATPQERLTSSVVRNAASVAPTMGAGAAMAGAANPYVSRLAQLLMAAPAAQVVGAGTGGYMQGVAAEGGAGPLGQAAANLAGGTLGSAAVSSLGGAGRLAQSLSQPFSQRGREEIVAETLLRSADNPRTLETRIAEGLADESRRLEGAVPTTGTAARNPSLLRVESSIRAGALGPLAQSMLSDSDFARTGLRQSAMDAMADTSNPAARGAGVRDVLQTQRDDIRDMVRAAYQSIDPDNVARFSPDNIRATLQGAIDRVYGPGSGGPPAELTAVLRDIPTANTEMRLIPGFSQPQAVSTPAQIDWRFLQNLRSRLGDIGGKAARDGDQRLAAVARDAWQEIERTAMNQVQAPQDYAQGLVSRWDTAGAFRRQQGEMFDRAPTGANATGQILRRDQYNNPMMSNERVPNAALRSADDLRQTLTAAGPQVEQVRAALRGQFIEDMLARTEAATTVTNTAGMTQRNLSIAGFQRYIDQNSDLIPMLFPGLARRQIDRLIADFQEGSIAATTGSTRNSQTIQNMTVGNLIARSTNGLLDPNSTFLQTFGSFGGLLRAVYRSPEELTRDMLGAALTDPNFARALLARASPAATQRAISYVERTMGQRIMARIEEAATGQALRSGSALQLQQEPQPQPPQ